MKKLFTIILFALITSCTDCGGDPMDCPTTANCGCSGKNKAQCADACCKWVTGKGCECR